MVDLFSALDAENAYRPLAEVMRPAQLDDVAGQAELLGAGAALRRAIENRQPHSLILWGPPGCGKTTLARLLAQRADSGFLTLSAVLAGVKEIRAATEQAQVLRAQHGQAAVLFVDEVHRFNKAQQDAFLPHIEAGLFHFVGATTENPAFHLNNALLSRLRVYVLKALPESALQSVLTRALTRLATQEDYQQIVFPETLQATLCRAVDGDARRLLNVTELVLQLGAQAGRCEVNEQVLAQALGQPLRRFDNGGDAFYDQISALHKAVRGSSPDAALYWFSRMIDAGCDPEYLSRRLIRIASEDIGNADPRALRVALDADQAYARLGSPEGELALAQAVLYLAVAAKSNAVYVAYKQSMAAVRSGASAEVPVHLRNAPTKLAKELGHGHAYRYAHNYPDAYVAGEQYFPESVDPQPFYQPVARGLEIRIGEKLEKLSALDQKARASANLSGKSDD